MTKENHFHLSELAMKENDTNTCNSSYKTAATKWSNREIFE